MKEPRQSSTFNLPSSIASVVAWLAVGAIVVWLLSLTLRGSDEIRLGRIRVSDPAHELNLQPFRNKVQPLRSMLGSQSPRVRRSARTYLFVDVVGNVAVFVPFGAALAGATLSARRGPARRRFWPWWLGVTGVGLLLSLFIEIVQLGIPSRVTDVDDVILNTLGTATGALFVWIVVRLFK